MVGNGGGNGAGSGGPANWVRSLRHASASSSARTCCSNIQSSLANGGGALRDAVMVANPPGSANSSCSNAANREMGLLRAPVDFRRVLEPLAIYHFSIKFPLRREPVHIIYR